MLVIMPNKSNRYYEIHDGPKWWTAKIKDDGRWFLMNSALRVVSPDGAIGKKVVEAIEDFEMRSDPQSAAEAASGGGFDPYNP